MSQFLININYVDQVLNPKRRGLSVNLQRTLRISSGLFQAWRNGKIPHKNNLERFSETLSTELTKKLNRKIKITAEELCDGDIKEIIEAQKRKNEPIRNDSVKEQRSIFGQQVTVFGITQPGWVSELIPKMTRPVPVLNRIPAGDPLIVTDSQFPVGHADEFVMSDVRDPNAYALVVLGDSMEPTLNEGEYVIVSPNAEPTNKCIVVFRLKNGEAGLKRYRQIGTTVHLEPDNEKYDVAQHNIIDFTFIHRVVEVNKKL